MSQAGQHAKNSHHAPELTLSTLRNVLSQREARVGMEAESRVKTADVYQRPCASPPGRFIVRLHIAAAARGECSPLFSSLNPSICPQRGLQSSGVHLFAVHCFLAACLRSAMRLASCIMAGCELGRNVCQLCVLLVV